MSKQKRYQEVHEKLDFLLEDHGVAFDDSGLDLESLDAFHDKADALLEAHNIAVPEGERDLAGLQPKLDMLVDGHGAEYDASAHHSDDWETVMEKLEVLAGEHRN